MSASASVADVASEGGEVLDELERAIVGKRDALRLTLAAALAGGHVLLEDLPGLGKTVLARSLAGVIGATFRRIQFTPDLLPADVTGATVLDPASRELVFRAGPVFAQVVLADEVNRAPPKTQSSLLEAMAERQVTVDGATHVLGPPFLVIATQNPVELDGTYPLPEAQLDRFLVRVQLGYPTRVDEVEILQRRVDRRAEVVELEQRLGPGRFVALQQAIETVHADHDILDYAARLADATRHHTGVRIGASPRGSLGLVHTARSLAALDGRDFVRPDDVKAVATPVLAHRLLLRSELWVEGQAAADVVAECVASVPVPAPAPGR